MIDARSQLDVFFLEILLSIIGEEKCNQLATLDTSANDVLELAAET